MPVTPTFLLIWLCAFAGAFIAGLLSHWVHSEFQPYADKLFDGGRTSDLVLNELMSPEHRVFGEYDAGGWWEFYSWRNYAIHTVPLLFLVLVTGLLNWNYQAEVIASICSGAGQMGLAPVFCGS
jgi:hypothetical protein